LRVTARGQDYAFGFSQGDEDWRTSAVADGRVLSSMVDGCFTGAYVGMYASGNGDASDTVADFDWFEYGPLTGTSALDG
jgi:alpha-N-arabinofuranosidase